MAERLFRKVIKISGWDSPNVRLALAQQAKGLPITNEILVPGVLTWEELQKRLATWDKIRQTIGIEGNFYEGREILMYPPDWLNRAHEIADRLRGKRRVAMGIGADPGEGAANTSMCAVDDKGVIDLVSKPTPDTSVIVGELIAFIHYHQVDPRHVCIDRGGGGKQIADEMKRRGFPPIRTVAFGESIALSPKNCRYLPRDRRENIEEKYIYINRRAQLFGDLRELLDPSLNLEGFGIPSEFYQLRQQMAPIPLNYDEEGRLLLPPKHKKPGQKESNIKCLVDIIGSSPDELDSLALACHAFIREDAKPKAGSLW